jgi:predicted alpha/beta hydrolase family esterase
VKQRVFSIHGWEGTPNEGWRPWLANELDKEGFKSIVPTMPDTDHPNKEAWVSHLSKQVGAPTQNDYFVGHSAGCITILRYLEELAEDEKVGGVVLVAGFTDNLGYKELESFFQTQLNWDKIKSHCPKFVAIMSDNDPFVPLRHGAVFKEKLAAKVIVEHDKKHYSGKDGINTLLSAKEAVLSISK